MKNSLAEKREEVLNDRMRVLIIDDESDFLELIKEYLTTNGVNIDVETCFTPWTILEQLESKRYDVIVADYQMPGIDGLEILERLRRNGDQTPFIVLTAHGREETVIQALNLGADYYLPKGIDLEHLFVELKHLILRAAEKNRVRIERQLAEKASQESEERFRTLFEGSPDAIFLADPETGIIIGANSRASELIARPHEEIISMHQAQLHPPRNEEYSRGTFKEHIINTKQKESVHPIENFVLRPDGTEVPVEVMAQMVSIKGRPVLQGVFRDITERKKVEKEKEHLINAINRSTEGITIADENDRFIYVNAAYARIFGRSQEELI